LGQVFAEKGATFIGGTGYQYGDTDFIAYSEQLYLDFTQQLRYGSGPVAVGRPWSRLNRPTWPPPPKCAESMKKHCWKPPCLACR